MNDIILLISCGLAGFGVGALFASWWIGRNAGWAD